MIQTHGMKCTFHWVVRSNNEGHPNAHCGEYLFGREIPAWLVERIKERKTEQCSEP